MCTESSNPRRPLWPEADYIIGNPPFIGGKDIIEATLVALARQGHVSVERGGYRLRREAKLIGVSCR
jgi:hypothetical protein